MPVSRRTAEQLARQVADYFADAQTKMLEHLARTIGADIHQPHWAELKAAQMGEYEAQMRQLVRDLQREAATGVHTALTRAYDRGGLAAVADLKQLGNVGTTPVEPLAQMRAVEALTNATTGYLNATGTRILTSTLEAYKRAVTAGEEARAAATAKGAINVLLGVQTRIQATQGVLDDFASSGVTGFVDAAGRSWDLSSYSEMAIRSGVMNAAVEGHVDTLVANDVTLGIISEDGSPCEDCSPWEGEIVSLDGSSDEYPSLDDAMAEGLMHPNCSHSCSAYQDGVTTSYPEKTDEEVAQQAQDYKDNQTLRRYERDVRAAKREEVVQLTAEGKAAAHAEVLAAQAKIREHVDSTNAVRQRAREQISRAAGRST